MQELDARSYLYVAGFWHSNWSILKVIGALGWRYARPDASRYLHDFMRSAA
jgi:hypothetical protein